jgi:drug/metabolite transporter (DMT)-like permease
VLLNSVIPILIIAINVLALREPLGMRSAMGVAVSLCGVLLIVARGELDTLVHLTLNPGDLYVLAAMLSWALYTVCLRWRPRALTSRAFTGSIVAIGVVLLLPLFAWDHAAGERTQWNAITLSAVAYFAVFPSVLAYFFWNAAVARVGSERAGTFLHLMPLFGSLLAWFFLGEALAWYHYGGAVLIFAGLFITSRGA